MRGVKRNARARRRRPVLPPLSPTRSTRGTGGRPKRLVFARCERLAVRLRKALTAQSALLPDSDGAAGGAGLGRRDGGATLQRNCGTADQTNGSRSFHRARNCLHVEGSAVELNFTSPRELFTSLIAPLTEEEFFSRYWEREPLLIKRSCPATSSPYTSLFSLAILRNLVQETPVKFGRHVNVCCYKRGRKRSYGEAGEALTAALLDRLWREKKATVQFFQPQQFQVSDCLKSGKKILYLSSPSSSFLFLWFWCRMSFGTCYLCLRPTLVVLSAQTSTSLRPVPRAWLHITTTWRHGNVIMYSASCSLENKLIPALLSLSLLCRCSYCSWRAVRNGVSTLRPPLFPTAPALTCHLTPSALPHMTWC